NEDRFDSDVHHDSSGADAARSAPLSRQPALRRTEAGCNRGACLSGVRSKEAPTVLFSTVLTLYEANVPLSWRSLGGSTNCSLWTTSANGIRTVPTLSAM